MSQNESFEKFIDFPIPNEKVEKLGRRLVDENWKINKERWTESESIEFYKGFYSCIRVMESLLENGITDYKPEFISDVISHYGLDCLFIIQRKIDSSK